jgi:hypothetical protein
MTTIRRFRLIDFSMVLQLRASRTRAALGGVYRRRGCSVPGLVLVFGELIITAHTIVFVAAP